VSELKKRYIISLPPETEALISEIQEAIRKILPAGLEELKVSKSLAVETAIKKYVEGLK
jgi:hypothetical protein